MKQGRNLNDVIRTLAMQEQTKMDYIVPASHMHFGEDGKTFSFDDNEYQMTDLFHSQVGSSLGIPAKYYGIMREKKPALLAENVNSWLRDRDSSQMVRTIDYGNGQTARAFLSDRYRRIDNLSIANAVLPLFAGNPQFEVASSEVTENKLYLKVLNKRLEREVVPGDYVQAGVMISNSEVGLGSVCVQPLVYRLVCTNGMVVNDMGEKKRHVGRTRTVGDEMYNIYSDETLEAEDKAFMLKLRDATMAAIDEARFDKIVDRLRVSTTNKITGNIQNVIELTAKNCLMNNEEQNGILKYLVSGGDLSQYGLANAITRTSQDVESYDRATVLEAVGWNVATMGNAAWRELNQAA